MGNNILKEELERMKSLFGYKKGKVISEQYLQTGFNTYTPPTAAVPPAPATVTRQSTNKSLPRDFIRPLVDCTGINKSPMDLPNSAQQQDFMEKSGLNPKDVANKEFYCSLQKMTYKVYGVQTSGTTTQKKPAAPIPIPKELKDINGVKSFQTWLDKTHPGWHKKYGKLENKPERGWGKYGPNTSAAWSNEGWKNEYLKYAEQLKQSNLSSVPGYATDFDNNAEPNKGTENTQTG